MSPRNAKHGTLQQQPRRISDEQKQQQAGFPVHWHSPRQMSSAARAASRVAGPDFIDSTQAR